MEPHPGRRGLGTLLAVLTFARVAYGVQFQSVGAVGPAMVAELGLDYAALGTLVGAYSTLGLALSLPAGWLIARLGDRRVVARSHGGDGRSRSGRAGRGGGRLGPTFGRPRRAARHAPLRQGSGRGG